MIQLMTTSLIRANSFVDSNVDDKSINTAIMLAQETMLQPKLGAALYKVLISGDTLEPDYVTLMNDKVKNAMLYYTIFQLVQMKFAKVVNTGVSISEHTNARTVELGELRQMQNVIEGFYTFYENELTAYLIENTDKFDEYDSENLGEIQADKIESTSIIFDYRKREVR